MKTKTIIKGTLLIGTLTVLSGCVASSYNSVVELNKNITHKENKCVQPDIKKSPWYVGNLYDCKTNSFFIPYQLWSGAKYNGDKKNSINHAVDINTHFQYREDKPSKTRTLSIKGSLPWINATTGEQLKIYKRTAYKKNYNKNEYFTFRPYGIGRVFDNKGYQYGLTKQDRYFTGKHIKAPAGYGWKINEPKTVKGYVDGISRTTTIVIKTMEFTDKNELDSITFDWLLNDGKSETINFKYGRNTGIIYQFGGK